MLNGHGTALAQDGSALPSRFGVFFFGNGRGVEADKWRPTGTGAAWTPSLELAPLMPIKDYVSVVTGMNARLANSPQGHHKGSAAILSGYDFITQAEEQRAVPLDVREAEHRSARRRRDRRRPRAFKSLELGISRRVINGEGTTIQYISHNGPDSGNPPEINPQARVRSAVRERRGAESGRRRPAVSEALRALRASVLDTVLEDLNALNTARRRGRPRAARAAHRGIRAIEKRLQAAGPGGVTVPACDDPMAPAAIQAENNREPIAERMDALGDLLALAMSCDLSRVFSIQFSGSAGGPVFWQVGATRAHHDLSHDGDVEPGHHGEDHGLHAWSSSPALHHASSATRPTAPATCSTRWRCSRPRTTPTAPRTSVDDYPVAGRRQGGRRARAPRRALRLAAKSTRTRCCSPLLRGVGVDLPEIGDGEQPDDGRRHGDRGVGAEVEAALYVAGIIDDRASSRGT